MNNGEPAPGAAVLGGAAATLFWTLMAALTSVGGSLGDAGLTAVTGATAVLLGGILYYIVPGKGS